MLRHDLILALQSLVNVVKYGTVTRPENARIIADGFGEYGPTAFGPTNISIDDVLVGVLVANNVIYQATKTVQVNSLEFLSNFGVTTAQALVWSGPADTIPEGSFPFPSTIWNAQNNQRLGQFRWITTLTVLGEPTRIRHFAPGEWMLAANDRIIIFFPSGNASNQLSYSLRMSDR